MNAHPFRSCLKLISAMFFCAVILLLPQLVWGQTRTVTVILVPHPEVANHPPTYPLSAVGRKRSELLVHTLRDIRFTHVFASHTTRSRETVEPVATANKIKVVQLPVPGSILDGQPVTDGTSRQAAINPLADAVLSLPAGSFVLIGANADNLYGILYRLGVPVPTNGTACLPRTICIPCSTKDCFPGGEFDRMWYLVIEAGRPKPIVMIESRYGAGWIPANSR